MKALSHIAVLILLILSSCAPAVYTGAEYDDLYYSASDKPEVKQKSVVNDQVAEKELKANNYYDNVYAADTLVTDKYSLPSDYDDQIVVNNSNAGGSGYDYYDDSYSNRVNMFYGNYFNPYWQDPYYFNVGFNYGYPYVGFGMNFGYGFGIGFGFGYGGYPYYGYGGYPYYHYGYPYDPYYGYGGYYGCCYPYYGSGYYPSDDYHTSYGRRERPSSLSSNYNDNLGTGGSGRRNSDGTTGGYSTAGGRTSSTNQVASSGTRRSAAGMTSGTTGQSGQDAVKSESATSRSAASSQRTVVNSRPDYKSANRTYTPSYNNPRMSTRPSYNNTRVSEGSGSAKSPGNGTAAGNRNFNSTAPVRNSASRVINQSSGSGQKSSSFSNMQRRYSSPSSSSRQYSVPSKGSSGSSRSYSSGESSGRSSYSGGSSSGGSRSSFSSGSSSSGSSGRSSSSSHSSGGRR